MAALQTELPPHGSRKDYHTPVVHLLGDEERNLAQVVFVRSSFWILNKTELCGFTCGISARRDIGHPQRFQTTSFAQVYDSYSEVAPVACVPETYLAKSGLVVRRIEGSTGGS